MQAAPSAPEFLQFLRYMDQNLPEDLDIHIFIDKYATHKMLP